MSGRRAAWMVCLGLWGCSANPGAATGAGAPADPAGQAPACAPRAGTKEPGGAWVAQDVMVQATQEDSGTVAVAVTSQGQVHVVSAPSQGPGWHAWREGTLWRHAPLEDMAAPVSLAAGSNGVLHMTGTGPSYRALGLAGTRQSMGPQGRGCVALALGPQGEPQAAWAGSGAWHHARWTQSGFVANAMDNIWLDTCAALAVDGHGHAHLVGGNWNCQPYPLFSYVTNASGAFEATQDGLELTGTPAVAVTPDNRVHVLLQDPHAHQVMHLTRNAGTWGTQAVAPLDSHDAVLALVAANNGTLHAAWPGAYAVQGGGAWTADPLPDAEPDASPALAVDGNGMPHVVYWARRAGQPDLRTLVHLERPNPVVCQPGVQGS